MSAPSARKGHQPHCAAHPIGRETRNMHRRSRSIRCAATAACSAVLVATAGTALGAEVTVQRGDTLSEIAADYAASWRDIWQANRDVIGADPDVIYPGQRLVIGGEPQVSAQSAPAPEPEPAVTVSLPVDDYRLTARFGQCGEHWAACHTGLDFAAPQGSAVRSVAAGTVIEAGPAGAYGNQLVVDHGDTTSSYSHLSEFIVTSGDVAAGEAIGRVGSTGNSTGPHLHLEVVQDGQHVDPEAYLRDRGVTP